MSTPETSRRTIALDLLFLPVKLLCVLAAMAWMAVTVPVLVAVISVTLLPAEVLWIASPFVGLVSPRAGHRLASAMEPMGDAFGAAVDVIWAPGGWLMDFALA